MTPYWAPTTQIKVCAWDAQDRLVGYGGTRCGTLDGFYDPSCGCGPQMQWCRTYYDYSTTQKGFAKDVELPKGVTLLSDEELLVVNVTQQVSAEALEAELAEAEAEAGIEHEAPESEAAEGESAEAAEGESAEGGSTDSE